MALYSAGQEARETNQQLHMSRKLRLASAGSNERRGAGHHFGRQGTLWRTQACVDVCEHVEMPPASIKLARVFRALVQQVGACHPFRQSMTVKW